MATVPTTEVKLKVDPKVSWGFTSIGGLLLAAGQYAFAIGNALSGGEINNGSLGLIATATITFLGVAAGRYKQASDVIKNVSGATPSAPDDQLRESNVLYLDGQQVANALIKALNTNALLASMTQPKPAPAPEPTATEEPS